MVTEVKLSKEQEIACEQMRMLALKHKQVPQELVAFAIGDIRSEKNNRDQEIKIPGLPSGTTKSDLLQGPKHLFLHATRLSRNVIRDQIQVAKADPGEKRRILERWNGMYRFVRQYINSEAAEMSGLATIFAGKLIDEGNRRFEIERESRPYRIPNYR